MKIEVITTESVYITINDVVFYIDMSTGDPYVNHWHESERE